MSGSPFGPNFSDKPPVIQSNPYGDLPSNPYAAPSTDLSMALPQSSGGVFRMNGKMVMHRQAVLPPRCIKTGEPAETAVTRKLYWHHPALVLLIFFPGILIYAIVALIVRKSMTFAFPLTHRMRSKLRMRIAIGVICLFAAFGAMFGGIALANQGQGNGGDVFSFAGLILFFVLLITSIVFFFLARLVTPTKITDQFTVVKGVAPEYLALLPEWPYGPVVP